LLGPAAAIGGGIYGMYSGIKKGGHHQQHYRKQVQLR